MRIKYHISRDAFTYQQSLETDSKQALFFCQLLEILLRQLLRTGFSQVQRSAILK